MPELCLLPQPQSLEFLGGDCHWDGERASVPLEVQIDAARVQRREGYILEILPGGPRVISHDEAGAFYGAITFEQITRQCAGVLPCLRIEDWPDYRHRGVMLDISRDKVPTMDTLYSLVDMLAEWKINQFQLYTEHTFAYRDHQEVWKDSSPMTAEEIRALDKYCAERHMELIPNQNSFGHMERWLKHPRYLHLAEAPDGFVDPWGTARGPYGLCATDPESIQFIEKLYDELLPNFSSQRFNVGCDETFDLGKGRSKAACEARGTGRVYLDFLIEIHKRAEKHGRTIQFWGDIVLHHPEMIRELPRDAVALNWGYEALHPFAVECEKFAQANVPFYVCPGTSGWNSIAGRTGNAIENIRNAAVNGIANGAAGLLNTEWGDNGHWQHTPVAWLGYACGAAASWNTSDYSALDLSRALNVHAFKDESGVMGKVAFELGNAYKHTGALPPNNSMLSLILLRLDSSIEEAQKYGVSGDSLERTLDWIQQAAKPLSAAKTAQAILVEEYGNTAALLAHACKLGLARLRNAGKSIRELPESERNSLGTDLEPIIAEYRRLWLKRNRPGGLNDSVGRLELLQKCYRNS